MVKIINESEFRELVLKSAGVVLVDFFATWCGPCKALAPVLLEVSEEVKDKAQIYKIDIDQNQNLAREFKVMSVPNMKIFKNGEVVESIVGLQSKSYIKDKLDYFSH